MLHNVERCRRHRDFTTFDGASPTAIAAAERALGTTFPEAYRTLLTATDGLGVLRGWLNWFGVGEHAPVDVVAFNRPDGWLAELPAGWLVQDGITWVGARYDHTLLGLRGHEAVFVSLLEPGAEPIAADVELPLTRGLEQGLARGIRGIRDRKWRRVVRAVGEVGLDEGLVLGPRHYADGLVDTSIVTRVQLHDALLLAAELAADRDAGPVRRGMPSWPTRWVRRRARLRLALAARTR